MKMSAAATNAAQRRDAGVQVVLVPNQRNRFELYRATPGDYRIYVWDALDQFGYFDLGLLRRDEQQAKRYTLRSPDRQTTEMRTISGAKFPLLFKEGMFKKHAKRFFERGW